jgi:hypothetical protein
VIRFLEQSTKKGLVSRYLDWSGALPVRDVLRTIGVEPISPDRVQLRDDAPFASIRRAMF